MSVGRDPIDVFVLATRIEFNAARGDAEALREIRSRIEARIGRLYELRHEFDAQIAKLDGPAVLPRPVNQTDKQRRVAKCPRCGTAASETT